MGVFMDGWYIWLGVLEWVAKNKTKSEAWGMGHGEGTKSAWLSYLQSWEILF